MTCQKLTAAEIRDLNVKELVDQSEELEIVTPGTKVNPTSNTNAILVEVINNDDALVLSGLSEAFVDANSSPPKGEPSTKYGSQLHAVYADANEVFIDSDTAGSKVTIVLYGRP